MKTAARRFYDAVSNALVDGGYGVFLDGRRLKTAMKNPLILPEADLAKLIADEWSAQGSQIKPETMPVTRLVNVAIDITPGQRQKLIQEAKNYAATDLLCYRADQPERLAERQKAHWNPVLEWASMRGVNLETTRTVRAIDQPAESLTVMAGFAGALDDIRLTLFVHFTASFGSAVLALAVMEGFLSAAAAFDLSRLDETFQAENWGVDSEAAARERALRAEIFALGQILSPASKL